MSEPLTPEPPGVSVPSEPEKQAPAQPTVPESAPDPEHGEPSQPAVPEEPVNEPIESFPKKPTMPKKKRSGTLLKWLILIAAGLAA